MSKFLKRFLQVTIFSTILTVVIMIGITLFINPNQFKEPLQQYVLNQTGHTLKIEGPIVWRWFPMLSIQLNQIVLNASEPFKGPLIASKSATVEVEPLALFAGKVFLNLKLEGVNLSLEKKANGQSNWESLKQLSNSKNSEAPSNPPSNPSDSNPVKPNRFALNSITIQNGQVIFKDEVKKTQYKLDNLNLSAENLFSGAFQKATPISLSFNLEDSESQRFGMALSGRYSLQSLDKINLQKLSLKITLPDSKTTELTGEATIQDLNTTPLIQGHCEAANLDLSQWLKSPNSTIPSSISVKTSFKYQSSKLQLSSLTIHSKTTGDLQGAMDINLGEGASQTLALTGQFSSKKLKLDQMTIEELKGNVTGKDTVFTIAPIDFQINKIPQHATLQIDLRGTNPRYSLTAEGRNFEINQILALFNAQNKIEGNTRYSAKLAATGKSMDEWKKSLSGEINIEIANGKFYGIDLINLLKGAQSNVYSLVNSLIHKQSFNLKNIVQTEQQKWNTYQPNPKAFTPFTAAKATVTMNNGLLKNSDLLIDHVEYQITGTGTADLNTLALQSQATALLKNNPYPADDKVANYLYTVPLPIKVTGTLSDPKIRPDLESYTNSAFAYAKKHVIEQAIDKTIHKAVDKGINKALEQLLKH